MFDVWLRGEMKARRISNKRLAKALEVDPVTVGRWLDGSTLPERKQVAKLCDFFKVSPVAILKLTDPDELYDFAADGSRQQEATDLLAQIPEMVGATQKLKRMSPKKRAAMLMLILDEDEEGEESSSQG